MFLYARQPSKRCVPAELDTETGSSATTIRLCTAADKKGSLAPRTSKKVGLRMQGVFTRCLGPEITPMVLLLRCSSEKTRSSPGHCVPWDPAWAVLDAQSILANSPDQTEENFGYWGTMPVSECVSWSM